MNFTLSLIKTLLQRGDLEPTQLPNRFSGFFRQLRQTSPRAHAFSIPTGLHPSAQGCEERATLGLSAIRSSTLKRLYHSRQFPFIRGNPSAIPEFLPSVTS